MQLLKKIPLVFFCLSQVASAGGETPSNTELDLPRLNAVIKVLADALVQDDEIVKALSLVVDEKYTNLDLNQFGFTASATVRRSAWSETDTTLGFGVKARIDKLSETKSKATVSLNARLATETLPLVHHVFSGSVVDHWCSPRKDLRLNEKLAEEDLCTLAKELGRLETIEALGLLLRNHISWQITYANADIAELNTLIAKDPQNRLLQAELRSQEFYVASLNRTQILERYQGGVFKGVSISSSKWDSNNFGMEKLSLYITQEEVSAKSIFTYQDSLKSYYDFKPELQKYLVALQNQSPDEQKGVVEFLKIYLAIAKEIILNSK